MLTGDASKALTSVPRKATFSNSSLIPSTVTDRLHNFIKAMSTLDVEDPHVPDQLVDQLTAGYDALATELKRVHEHSRQLENKLAWAKRQVCFFSLP
jgi:hypothetical protein